MTDPEQRFIQELEIFRTEAQAGAQFLYAYLSFNSIVGRRQKALYAVNKTPLFWNTAMGALQTAFFMTLGRMFDQNSPHNIDGLMKLAQTNMEIFSKTALANRKRRGSNNADEWLPEYLKTVYEPTNKDFRILRKKVKEYRVIYESNYRDIRHKIYAHKAASDAGEVRKLFSKTNIRELQKVFVFVNSLYEALWQLLFNGRKPILRSMRYSVKGMLRDRKMEWESESVQERMVSEVNDLLKIITRNSQQSTKTRKSRPDF